MPKLLAADEEFPIRPLNQGQVPIQKQAPKQEKQ